MTITPETSTISLTAYTYMNGTPIPVTTVPYGNFLYFHVNVLSASGNGTASGMVTFQDGATTLGSIALNSKGEGELVSGGYSAFGAVLCLPVGSHAITATYSGDNSLNASSTTPAMTITITPATPSVFFENLTPLNIITNQQLTLVGLMKGTGPILPTGTVQFLDGGTPIGSPVSILSGTFKAMNSVTLSAPGTHSISMSYSGDNVYQASNLNTFGPLSVTVTNPVGIATQTQLTVPASVTFGNIITYAVTVTSAQAPQPTGTVQVIPSDCPGCLNPISLQNGPGSTQQAPIGAGPLIAVAQYSGDSTYAASSSPAQTIMVSQGHAAIAVQASASAVASGGRVSLTATLSPPITTGAESFPTDQVQFLDSLNGGTVQPLAAPQYLTFGNGFPLEAATLPVALADGTHQLTVQFFGDSNLNAVSSAPITVTVGSQAAPPGSFAISTNPTAQSITAGQKATYSLKITPQNGFASAVTPTCTGLPANTTCLASPASVVLDGIDPSSISITIATTARSAAALKKEGSRLPYSWAIALFFLSTVVLCSRRQGRMAGPAVVLLLMSLSCGGGSYGGGGGGGGGGGRGTPTGTYTVTITATSGNLSRSTVVSLTIN